jgi:hypothetical protein
MYQNCQKTTSYGMSIAFSGRSKVIWTAALGLVGFWWWLCYSRVADWKTVEQITLVDGLKQLRSSRTQFNLANLYLQSQRS